MAMVVLDHAPRQDDVPASDSPAVRGGPFVTRRATLVALFVLTIIGALVRARGLSSLGLWRDDAWVGLSTKVGIGTAWHMWVTAPGFYFVERTLSLVDPGSTAWSQVFPFALGLGAIPAMYATARTFSFSRRCGLALAFLVCVSPVAVIYSTHIKEYGADCLVSCAVLVVGEMARRQCSTRHLRHLALVSVVGFSISASVGPEIVAVWLALVVLTRPRGDVVASIGPSLAATALGCGCIAALFYRHLSPYIGKPWAGWYVVHTSVTALAGSLVTTGWRVESHLLDLPPVSPAVCLLLFLAVNGLIVLGACRSPRMVAPALVVAGALTTSALGITPLGTGRTDEYLYPALLMLLGAGLGKAIEVVRPFISRPTRWAGVTLVGVLGVAALGGALALASPYPGENVQALAATVRAHELPGDHIVVDELMSYPWALYEDRIPHIVFGSNWSTGFTVVSTDPHTFLVPSEYYEGGSMPERWARALSGYRRLWFVETPPLSLSPTYAALIKEGWRPIRTLSATGCAAILLEHPGPSSHG
jgi:hypothetical protein